MLHHKHNLKRGGVRFHDSVTYLLFVSCYPSVKSTGVVLSMSVQNNQNTTQIDRNKKLKPDDSFYQKDHHLSINVDSFTALTELPLYLFVIISRKM